MCSAAWPSQATLDAIEQYREEQRKKAAMTRRLNVLEALGELDDLGIAVEPLPQFVVATDQERIFEDARLITA